MALTFILALAQNLLIKDRITREGRWDERTRHMGKGLGGRTLGLVGFGNMGRDLTTLVRPFEMRVIVYDPMVEAADATALGVELTTLDDLLARSDFVSVHVPLMPATRHLIGAREIGLMRPEAYLINTARGPVVDQAALTQALRGGTSRGRGSMCSRSSRSHPTMLCWRSTTSCSRRTACAGRTSAGAAARRARSRPSRRLPPAGARLTSSTNRHWTILASLGTWRTARHHPSSELSTSCGPRQAGNGTT